VRLWPAIDVTIADIDLLTPRLMLRRVLTAL
jgi:hypothetical protein